MHQEGSIIAKRYRLEELLGEGGMGAVYRATHLDLGRAVALKLVQKEKSSEQFLKRFLREARLAASVRHRNVIDVIDFGRDEEEQPYLVMELLEGESLEQRLAREPAPSLHEILEWLDGALAGLGAIHDAGIVHRDLKPANLFLAHDGEGIVPKVLDFGISRALDPAQQGSVLTHTLQTLGTPHYMSPEQIRSARDVDARSDIYAMGVILYESLAGRRPFDGPSAPAIIASIVSDEPPPLKELRPDLPPSLGRIIKRAMGRAPEERFEGAQELREALRRAGQADEQNTQNIPKTRIEEGKSDQTPKDVEKTPRRPRRRFLFGLSGGLMGLLGMSAAFLLFYTQGARDNTGVGSDQAGLASEMGVPIVLGVPPLGGRDGGTGDPRRDDARELPATLPLATLAMRWRELPAALRTAETRFFPAESQSPGERRFGLVPQGSEAEALYTALGIRPSWGAWERGLRPALVHTTDRLNVRARPGLAGELQASLPPGTVAVAFYGAIPWVAGEGEENPSSEPGGRGRWSYLVVSEALEGFAASSYVEVERGCVPSLQAVGEALGPSFGEGARADRLIARAELWRGGRPEPALLVLRRREGSSAVGVAAISATCELRALRTYNLPGYVEEAFFSSTLSPSEAGSEPLLLIGHRGLAESYDPGAPRIWRAYLLDREEPVWERPLPSSLRLPRSLRQSIDGPHEEGPAGARGFWPLRIQEPGQEPLFFLFREGTLAPTEPTPSRIEPP